MNKTFAAAAMAASLTVGGLAGAAIGVPGIAGATDLTTGAVDTASRGAGWVQDALSGLVGDGTITQEQADAVETALQDARPERQGHGFRHLGDGTVADALGMTEDELRDALAGGPSVSDVAAAQGVEVQAVVEAVIADLEARLADRVEAGHITQDRADELLAGAEERVTAFIEGETPASGGGHRRGGR
jgi:hypothetical protein